MKKYSPIRLLKLIGPYPLNPKLVALFFFAILFSRFIQPIENVDAGPRKLLTFVLVLALALLLSFYLIFAVRTLNKIRFWSSESTFLYVCEVAFVQSTLLFIVPLLQLLLLSHLDYPIQIAIAQSPRHFIAALCLVLIALAFTHRIEVEINARLQEANILLGELTEVQRNLIKADEEIRERTSRFLHDRVQTDLMLIAMKLKMLGSKSSVEKNNGIEELISDLERLRTTDIRQMIQLLTPNFEVNEIDSAIQNLRERYGEGINITSELSQEVRNLSPKSLLGIFRILEQSLQNALIHGPASNLHISIKLSEGECFLLVSDDGPGANLEGLRQGVGSAIIDSWVEILKGKKQIDSAIGHGYQLQVTFPV